MSHSRSLTLFESGKIWAIGGLDSKHRRQRGGVESKSIFGGWNWNWDHFKLFSRQCFYRNCIAEFFHLSNALRVFYKKLPILAFFRWAPSFLPKNSNIWKSLHPLPYLMLFRPWAFFLWNICNSNVIILENSKKMQKFEAWSLETEFLVRKKKPRVLHISYV